MEKLGTQEKVWPGINPLVTLTHFDDQEQEIIDRVARDWYVTNGGEELWLGPTSNYRYILIKHILPNTLPLILANVILGVVNAILGEAGIAFLGFVDIHGQPSWGIMLHWANKNAALLNSAWWWIIPPGLLILLTALGFVFISHAADKVVNPRLRGRRG